jgi:hypothetical protein
VNVGAKHHQHCSAHVLGPPPSSEDRENLIAEEVVEFLSALFDNRILLWETPNHRIGGWIRVQDTPSHPPEQGEKRWALWSGPLV